MKEIDLTGQVPIIGGEKEKWLFRCANCGYQAVFILWRGQGMSTACEKCGGDMERAQLLELPPDYEWLMVKIRAGEIEPDNEFFLFTCDDVIIAYRGDMLPVFNSEFLESFFRQV